MVKIKHYLIVCFLLMLFGEGYSQGGITVSTGTDITVSTGTTLDIGSGNLLLMDDLSTSPSFLEKGSLTFSGGGEAFIEQYLSKDSWHIVSSSVSNEVNGAFMWMYMYSYAESNNSWTVMNQPVNQPLNPGKGYFLWSYTVDPNSTWPTSPDSVVLNGLLNKTDLALTLSNTDASPKSGWNLIGNPYPCAIDWNSNWVSTNVGSTVYLYDDAGTGNYQTWNWNTSIGTNGKIDGNIPAGQGFWVRADDTTGVATSMTIPQSERLHSSQPFLKNSWEQLLRLKVAGNTGSDETVICFSEQTTTGFDAEFDAWHIMGNDEALSLYSDLYNNSYAVNFLPAIEDNQTIPVNFIAKQTSDFSITASGMASFAGDIPIWLEDTQENFFQDLRINAIYSFVATPTDLPGRFVIHFANPLGVDDTNNSDRINIYAFDKAVYVNIPVNSFIEGYCIIYDMMGSKVKGQAVTEGLNTIPAAFNKGYYVVTINTGSGEMITDKVFIK